MHHDIQNRSFPISNQIRQLIFDTENFPASEIQYAPFFYAEIRIDFNDVRTGLRATASLNKAIEMHQATPDMSWAEDMILDIDPRQIKSLLPGAEFHGQLPDFVNAGYMLRMENQFIHFLLRTYKTRVYRNFELEAYSYSGESQTEFCARCLDLLEEPKRLELDDLHEVFTRKLEQIRQRYLNSASSENLDRAKAEAQDRNLFLSYSDRMADLFLHPGIRLNPTTAESGPSGNNFDLEERLASLNLEAQQEIAKIRDSYEQKARSVDEYILHPNLKDIHFVRCCILWIPTKAA